MSDSIPPTDLVLAALHAIKSAVDRNTTEIRDRLDRLESSQQATNERLDTLRVQTMQKFTDLTVKVDEGFAAQTRAVQRNTAEVHGLRERFDHFLSGAGAQLVLRVDKVDH